MYNINNHYWIVAGSTQNVFSSLKQQYVAVSDSDYQAWLASGNSPTHIAVASDLFDVVKQGVEVQLSQLDSLIPRGLEDMWTASHFDTTTLPAIQQTRLATKQNLRTQLAALKTLITA